MKPRDILALVIRLLGVLFFYRAMEAVPMVWRVVSMGFSHFAWNLFFDSFLMVAWQIVVAFWLINGAPPVMSWAYPDDTKERK